MIEYVHHKSPLHMLNAITKMVWLVVIMLAALLYTHYIYLTVLLVSVLLVAFCGGVLKELLPAFKGLLTLAAVMIMLQVLFNNSGVVLFYLFAGKYLAVHQDAVKLGIAMGLRTMAILLSFLTFLATTQYKDITLTLTEKIKLPYNYVFMFMTALRFVPVFLNEFKLVRDAQSCRGCIVDGHNPLIKIKAYTPIAVPLVMISLQKAERLAIAMETRGFGSGKRTAYQVQQLQKCDWLALGTMILTSGLVITIRWQGYGLI